jgi:hypothetical protein
MKKSRVLRASSDRSCLMHFASSLRRAQLDHRIGLANRAMAIMAINVPVVAAAVPVGTVLYPVAYSGDPAAGITQEAGGQTSGYFESAFNPPNLISHHALLWASATPVDINPTNQGNISDSEANSTDGTQQVGYQSGTATGGNIHAVLWSGSANTAIDLGKLKR